MFFAGAGTGILEVDVGCVVQVDVGCVVDVVGGVDVGIGDDGRACVLSWQIALGSVSSSCRGLRPLSSAVLMGVMCSHTIEPVVVCIAFLHHHLYLCSNCVVLCSVVLCCVVLCCVVLCWPAARAIYKSS